MNPREVEVHIEELVLHGFAADARWSIADGLQSELRGLLAERGVPAAWQTSPERIDAGSIRLTNPGSTGKAVAAAIHQGGVS
jgi:hypothetical protein